MRGITLVARGERIFREAPSGSPIYFRAISVTIFFYRALNFDMLCHSGPWYPSIPVVCYSDASNYASLMALTFDERAGEVSSLRTRAYHPAKLLSLEHVGAFDFLPHPLRLFSTDVAFNRLKMIYWKDSRPLACL